MPRRPERVQIMYGVGGERDRSEHTLDHLSSHRDSRPVRVGTTPGPNGRLGVLGEVLDAAHVLRTSWATWASPSRS